VEESQSYRLDVHIHDSNLSANARLGMGLKVLNGKGRHDEDIAAYNKAQPRPIILMVGTNPTKLINVYKEQVNLEPSSR
jgi:hypothetical protein